MKKALSILLSVLIIFSVASFAFAEDATVTEPPITINFYVDGILKQTIKVSEGDKATASYVVTAIGNPESEAANESATYTFDGWVPCDENGNKVESDVKYYSGTFPAHYLKEGETESVYNYCATFVVEEKDTENITFWQLIQSIFARMNSIFEYFAKIFEGIIDFD